MVLLGIDRPALVSAKVRVRKPKKFADSIDFEIYLFVGNTRPTFRLSPE